MSRSRVILVTVLLMIILSLIANKKAFVLEAEHIEYNPDNLLRLHIIPNSNSLADQSLKRMVKKEIIRKVKPIFLEANSIGEAAQIAQKEIIYIEEIINEKINELNFNYEIEVDVGRYYFPTRSYGASNLVEGEYNALRVVIGKGEGANWWCVLFPPLCFIDSAEERVEDIGQDISVEGDFDVDYRFKLVEYLESNPQFIQSALKLAKVFSWND